MTYTRKNIGTCSTQTQVSLAPDGTIEEVQVKGGCNGNLKGICQLVKGQNAQEVIDKLEGTLCGNKSTSCPDQLSKALRLALEKSAQ